MVIRRGANAATTKHNVIAGETARKRLSQRRAIIRKDFNPGQLKAPRCKQLNDFGKVLVLAATRQNFIANDN
jgi:hypothetical protein